MTNTEAQQVLGTMLMRYDLTDAELEAIGMAGEALEDDWISVEERLPEGDDVNVLTYRPGVALGDSCNNEHFFKDIGWTMDGFYAAYPVTHWRPFPKPPEVD